MTMAGINISDRTVTALPEPIVEFRSVQKTYDGKSLVVQDLDLEVRRGEFLTLLGPSGSGKTTALMMLAGFEVPTQGSILLNGKSVEQLPSYKREIGVVFQNYALFPHMSVAQNLAFPLEVRKRPQSEITKQVDKALSLVRLSGLGSRRPSALSGGQQQRIALARALVFEPQLVLMDEPLGALDRQLREHMQIEIKQIHRDLGITIVYVTHDQSEAMTMSDRVAVFHDGRIQQLAPPLDLYERPDTSFVARFIGENNTLPGIIEASEGTMCKVRIGEATILAANMDKRPEGAACVVSVRPERLTVNPQNPEMENRLFVELEEIVHLGDHAMLCLTAPSDIKLVAKIAADHPAIAAARGDKIQLGCRAGDCRAFSAS